MSSPITATFPPEVRHQLSAADLVAADHLRAPMPTGSIAAIVPRARTVVGAVVRDVEVVAWAGGPVLEATVADGTGEVILAFLGRRAVAGVTPGTPIVAAGTAGRHAGRLVILNPAIWLSAADETGAR